MSPGTPSVLSNSFFTRNRDSGSGFSELSQVIAVRISARPALELIRELQIASRDSKNNRSKILKLLEDLSIYFAVEALNEEKFNSASVIGKNLSATMSAFLSQIIQLFELDERKNTPYLHYFISDINLNPEDKHNLALVMKREYATRVTLYQKAYALRSLSRLCRLNRTPAEFSTLTEILNDVMKNFGQPESIAVKRNLKSLLGVTDKDKTEKLFLLRTALQTFKDFVHDPNVYQPYMAEVFNAARNRDGETARDAIVLLSSIASRTGKHNESFSSILPHFVITRNALMAGALTNQISHPVSVFDLSKFNQNDLKKNTLLPCSNPEHVFARFHLARICAHAIDLPRSGFFNEEEQSLGEDTAGGPKFKETLNYLLHDEELTVFFEAVKTASQRSFEYFTDKDVYQQTQMILDHVVSRICSSLKKGKPQIQLHAACRAAGFLSTSFSLFLSRVESSDSTTSRGDVAILKNTMRRLYQKVEDVGLGYDCTFVRLAAYKCLVWREDEIEGIIDRLKIEIKNNETLIPFHLHEIMSAMLSFAKEQPRIFKHFEEVCSYICITIPERVDTEMLIGMFSSLIPTKSRTREQNEMISSFLTMIFRILDDSLTGSKQSLELSLTLYEFLGEYANKICDEPSLTERNILNTNHDPELKKLKPNEVFKRDELWDIMVGSVKSIVLRFMHSTLYNTPQIRVACLDGLTKIAFRSLDPVRLYIYQFFSSLTQSDDFGISSHCSDVTQLLDELYHLQQHFVKLTTNENVSDRDLVYFFDTHEQIKEKISFFCRFAPSFLPLGLPTKTYLARGFNAKKREMSM
ncbi:hypothetical protein AKO1_015259 [Acrasis kona]|uniref:Uncharacterized protein n=1 Tax=Acrasis kona TaxID=1008807 RepID=A0AAW2ZGY6_9EUKA